MEATDGKTRKRSDRTPDFNARLEKINILVMVFEGLVKIFTNQTSISNAVCVKFTPDGISIFAQTQVSPIVGLCHLGLYFFSDFQCQTEHVSWIPVYRLQSTIASLKAMMKASVPSVLISSTANEPLTIIGTSTTNKFKLFMATVHNDEPLLEIDTVYNWEVSVVSQTFFQSLNFLSTDKGASEINEVKLTIGSSSITFQGFDACGQQRDECQLTDFKNNYSDTYSGRFQRKLLNVVSTCKSLSKLVHVYFNLGAEDPLRFTWLLESSANTSHLTYYIMSMVSEEY